MTETLNRLLDDVLSEERLQAILDVGNQKPSSIADQYVADTILERCWVCTEREILNDLGLCDNCAVRLEQTGEELYE